MQKLYGGRYDQLQRIGNGAYGVIYKVREVKEGNIYIAKHIPLHQIQKDKAMQQFQILSRLRHHYIVKYLDSFIEDHEIILIMQYCGQKDLGWHIQQRRKSHKYFNQSLVTNWILQLFLAIGFMHANKILHRDIKPQNIFVDSQMNLKVGDFGISKLLDSTTQNCKTTAGTPSYMAPQMIDSEKYDMKADIWSLGCVIYQVCTLQRLFPPKDEQDKPIGIFKMMQLIKSSQIKDIPPFYSKDLRDLIRKMLNRNPKNRPKCQDLLKDKLLVQLMIKRINNNDNLKQQYPKGIQPPSLSDSLLNRQAQSVKQQMKKMQQEVNLKILSLKNKRIEKNQLSKYQKQVKAKMEQVQKAIRVAFKQLYDKGKFSQKQEQLNSKQSKKQKTSQQKKTANSSSSSEEVVSKMMSSSLKLKNSNMSESSIDFVQSQMINSKVSKLQKSINNNSNLSETIKSQFQNTMRSKQSKQDIFQGTIQTQFAQTTNDPIAIAATMNKLQLLQQTIKKNPEALLNQSFLNCTLSLSSDPYKSLKPQKKQEQSMSASMSFQLTKKSQPKPQKQSNVIHEGLQQYQSEYQQDFENYDENQDISQRRANELQSMISLYQKTLLDLGKTQSQSQTQQFRNKYLVMSEIKQQSNEGGSMISRQEI